MQNKSIKLNPKELEVIQDRSFLVAKQNAIDKIVNLFSDLREWIDPIWEQQEWRDLIPASKDDVKISKGENYRQLPYVILDYPRLFSREDVFAFRSMFWWGHFFSFTLHLQGKSFEQYREHLKDSLAQLPSGTDLFICVANKPWEYHYGPTNYKPLASLGKSDIASILDEKDFVKISSWIHLTEDTEQIFTEGKQKFEHLMNLLFKYS